MAINFEDVIRPFVGEDVTPRPGVTSIPRPSQNVLLIVRGAGALKLGHFSYSFSSTQYMDAQQKEQTGGSSDFSFTPIGTF